MNSNSPLEIHPFVNRWFDFNKSALTPEANTAWVIDQEKGYFGFLPNRQIKHLIVGSFPIWASVHQNPPHLSFDFAFFYCSRANRFFEILENISGYEFFPDSESTTPHQKTQSIANFFLQKQLGITDILEKVQRVDEQCKSALDRDLNPLSYNNLCQLLSDYPEITHLYFTSRKVEQFYKRQIKKCPVNRTIHSSVLFSPALTANIAAAGIINRDIKTYGRENSILFHSSQIPLFQEVTVGNRFRRSIWAKHLRNVPDLVRLEILEHPNFIAIENRF